MDRKLASSVLVDRQTLTLLRKAHPVHAQHKLNVSSCNVVSTYTDSRQSRPAKNNMTSINPLNGHVNRSIPTTKDSPYGRHLQRVLEHHQRLEHLTSSENKEASITICGNDLALADIVAASR